MIPLKTIGFGGAQVVFATFFSQGVTHLRLLGLTKSEIAITLLSGPVCGAVFQPYFGSLSDHLQCRWGRRKPFVVVGTVFVIASLLSLSWIKAIIAAALRGRYSDDHEIYQRSVVICAVVLCFILFCAMQAVQVGLRGLITEAHLPNELMIANAWAGRHSSLAAVLAYLSAYMDLPRYTLFGNTVFKSMSVLTAVYLITTITITCLYTTTRSSRMQVSVASHLKGRSNLISDIFLGSYDQIKMVCLVQFFAWLGWFPFLYYTVPYLKTYCTLGSNDNAHSIFSSGERCERRLGPLTLLIYNSVALLMTILLPCLIKQNGRFTAQKITMRHLWIASHGIFAVSMLGTILVKSLIGTVVLFSVVGFSWAASSWIPFAFLSAEISKIAPRISNSWDLPFQNGHRDLSDHSGSIYGIHNVAVCLPQILMTLIMGIIWGRDVKHAEEREFGPEIVWFLRIGGIFSLVAMYYSTKIREPSIEDIEHIGIACIDRSSMESIIEL